MKEKYAFDPIHVKTPRLIMEDLKKSKIELKNDVLKGIVGRDELIEIKNSLHSVNVFFGSDTDEDDKYIDELLQLEQK